MPYLSALEVFHDEALYKYTFTFTFTFTLPNSVTLVDLERRNNLNRRVISPNSVAFGADYVKVVEGKPVLSAAEM